MKKDWDYLDKKLEELDKAGKTCLQCSELDDCGIAHEPKTDINTDVCTDFNPR